MKIKKTSKKVFLFLFFVQASTFILCQNVGIGTLTPAEKLEVAGNIKADTLKSNEFQLGTNSGNGKILTSDDFGNASWQDNTIQPTTTPNLEHADGNEGFGLWGDCGTYPNIDGFHPVTNDEPHDYDGFGGSVDITGNYAIVGAGSDDVTYTNQGSASIFFYNENAWSFHQLLVDPEGEVGDNFGVSVSMFGNYAVVGSYSDDVEGIVNQGSVCIFQFDGTSWVFMEKIVDPEGQANDYFGIDVVISGDDMVIGAYEDDDSYANQGSACVFHFNGSNWEFVQKLIDPVGASDDNFGTAVSLDGEFIMIGSPFDIGNYLAQGSVSIFQFDGSVWQYVSKLTSTPYEHANFGYSIDLDGNYAVVGSPYYGSLYSGKASLYWYNGTTWVLSTEFSQSTSDDEETFGSAVSISGSYILIGTPNDVTYYGRHGSAAVYVRTGRKWTRLQFILDPIYILFDYFGGAVSIDNAGHFLIGEPGYDSNSGKAVFGKVK